VVINCM